MVKKPKVKNKSVNPEVALAIKHFDYNLEQSYQTNSLHIRSSTINVFLESSCDLNHIQKLSFKSCLDTFPKKVGKLTNLRHLYLGGNNLTTLSEDIGNLTNLRTLYLSDNQFIDLHPALVNLTNLDDMQLQKNNLTKLPEYIGQLTAITDLVLYHNKLTALPESICNLSKLTALNVHYNCLTALPNNIGHLQNLTIIRAEDNLIQTLPDSITNLPALKRIELWDNPIEDLSILKNMPGLEVNFPKWRQLDSRFLTKLSEWQPEWIDDEFLDNFITLYMYYQQIESSHKNDFDPDVHAAFASASYEFNHKIYALARARMSRLGI